MANSPVIFGAQHMTKALSDSSFFEALPEFLTVKSKMETMKVNLENNKGCTPCKMRKARNSVNSDFLSIMSSLSQDGKERFKKYFGVDRLLFNKTDPKTYRVTLMEM